MEQKKRVIVAGAGAAGLMAAITAARAGASVTVLEAMERPGKKLLLTGNGRCNLTNLDPALPMAYYGTGAVLAASVIKQFDAKKLIGWFEELGLLVQEKNGYVYPYSAQSGSVLEVLLAEARHLKVKLKYSEKITEIQKHSAPSQDEPEWEVKTQTWRYSADAVILACGSKAVMTTGSDGSGYTLAASLGHTIQTVKPALTPVTCKEKFLPQLSGVRCRACVTLFEQMGKKEPVMLHQEKGELQWTKYGVSGIVIFQLSRFVVPEEKNRRQFLSIDLLPDFETEKLYELLLRRAVLLGEEKAGVLLAGMLPEKLIPVILSCADQGQKGQKPLAKTTCQKLSKEQIWQLLHTIKQFGLEVTGTKSFDTAQVCAGGVDGNEVWIDTLESKLHRGLYFAGELLDVDGPCGGYNLQWAWSSGYLAGSCAAQCLESERESYDHSN